MQVEPLCRLLSSGETFTPVSVFNWVARARDLTHAEARKLSDWYVGAGVNFWAEICCDGPETLSLLIHNEQVIVVGFKFTVGPPALTAPLHAVVADLADALHMAGMLVLALDARIMQVSDMGEEVNSQIRSSQPASSPKSRLALPDHCRHVPRGQEQPGTPAVVTHAVSNTPLEMFNWAVLAVQEISRDLCDPAFHAILQAYRDQDKQVLRFTVIAADELFERNGVSPDPRRYREIERIFVARGDHDYRERRPSVPDLTQALHMAGLILRALRVESIRLGSQWCEVNPDVLDGRRGTVRVVADHQRHKARGDR